MLLATIKIGVKFLLIPKYAVLGVATGIKISHLLTAHNFALFGKCTRASCLKIPR